MIPVLAPVTIAWIAAGFRIDDKLARALQEFTKLGVAFFHSSITTNQCFSSKLPDPGIRSAMPFFLSARQ